MAKGDSGGGSLVGEFLNNIPNHLTDKGENPDWNPGRVVHLEVWIGWVLAVGDFWLRPTHEKVLLFQLAYLLVF